MSVRRISAAFQASLRPPDQRWFTAASEDDVETVAALVAARVDPNGVDRAGNTALHLAAYKGAAEVVKLLLRCPIDVNARNKQSLTPFLLAASAGLDFITNIFMQDERVEQKVTDEVGATALHLGAGAYNAALVTRLLNNGFAVNLRDDLGFTPLMYAVRAGELLSAAALIDGGADLQLCSSAGLTALDIAEKFRHTSLAAFIRKFLPPQAAAIDASPAVQEVVEEEPLRDAPVPTVIFDLPTENLEVDEIYDHKTASVPVQPAETLQAPAAGDAHKSDELSSLIAMLREFHASEENRSPEFADEVKWRIDEMFAQLSVGEKIPKHVLTAAFAPAESLVMTDAVDKRTFAIILTALATL